MSKDSDKQQEYKEFIKESVKDGSYFKDALDWYIFRYVNPVCERTIFFFIALISIFVTYNLAITIKNSLPMVEEVPVVIREKDSSVYFPVIKKLKDSDNLRTIDEAVVKYLLVTYLKDREEYDFRRSDIEVVNRKFRRIKNNSSVREYRNFQEFMSEDNPGSPINNFGKNVTRQIEITSFDFKRMEVNNVIDKARDFISIDIPTQAEIRYNATTFINDKPVVEKYLTRIFFKFSGVNINNTNNSQKRIGFTVTDYKTYIVK